MRIYLVLAWDDYYPDVNNIKGAFLLKEEAEAFKFTLSKTARHFNHIELDWIEVK